MNNTNTTRRRFGLAISAATACALLADHASVAGTDGAPDLDGVFYLRHGIYVAEGSKCAAPANAALRRYDGVGIGTAHTHACAAIVHGRDHDAYSIEQSCIDAGTGPGPCVWEKQKILVRDPSTFVQVIGTDSTTYHFFPVSSLPAGCSL